MGKAKKFGIIVLSIFLFFVVVTVFGTDWENVDPPKFNAYDNDGCRDGYYPVSDTKCCEIGTVYIDFLNACRDPATAEELMGVSQGSSSGSYQGSSSGSYQGSSSGSYQGSSSGSYQGSSSGSYQGSSSGSSCGGMGSIFVTQPISIVGAAVVEIDGYSGGITNMQIPLSSGNHFVEAWGVTSSGYEQRMSWNTYVNDCKQTLIKWN